MKKLMIPLTLSTYAIAAFLILSVYIDKKWPLYSWLIAAIVCFLLSLINIIYAIFKRKEDGIYRDSLIFKLILIPFFIFNFILTILIISTSVFSIFTAFFFASLPLILVGALTVLYAYLLLLSTSIYSVKVKLRNIYKSKNPIKDIILVVFHFIFILDVIAAIIFYKDYKKRLSMENNKGDLDYEKRQD